MSTGIASARIGTGSTAVFDPVYEFDIRAGIEFGGFARGGIFNEKTKRATPFGGQGRGILLVNQ